MDTPPNTPRRALILPFSVSLLMLGSLACAGAEDPGGRTNTTTTFGTSFEGGSSGNSDCLPGEQNCECDAGSCNVGLECVNGECIDPDCYPGTEHCECTPDDSCLGQLECEDGTCEQPTDDCVPQDHFQCVDGDVYWFDSCGVQGSIKEGCGAGQICAQINEAQAECEPENIVDCGNGEIDLGEACDGGNLNGETCDSLGHGGGTLACKENCTFDTTGCATCGNNILDVGEDCDGLALGGESCSSMGYDDGDLGCTSQCEFDVGECFDCECSSGACCDDCNFRSSNYTCEQDADVEYGCPDGTSAGDDVSVRSRDRMCSGSSSSCSGNYSSWSGWSTHDNCSNTEVCAPGDSSCNNCDWQFDVTQYECQSFSSANGSGDGGGELMELCATTNSQTGHMQVFARKHDNGIFSSRPYQVRVSSSDSPNCGPDTWFFDVSDSDPNGIGTSQLVFTFAGNWLPGQYEKAYCVTASVQPGDPGYDPNNPQHQSWWWSEKVVVERTCN